MKLIMENWRKYLKEEEENANLNTKKIVNRAFQIVREIGTLAGHSKLATASSMFRFGSSEYNIVIKNNTGEQEGTHSYASYQPASVPNFHVLMPKANAKNPVKHTEETIIVSAKYVNQISLNVVNASKNLKDIDQDILTEVASLMLAPVIAHELEHYRYRLQFLKGIFSPLDYEGTDFPSNHWNRVTRMNAKALSSDRMRYSSERSAISVMPDFQEVIISNIVRDVLKDVPEEEKEKFFKLVSLEFNSQNKNAKNIVSSQEKEISNKQKAFKDTQPNLYKGWQDRYSYLMAKKSTKEKDKIAPTLKPAP